MRFLVVRLMEKNELDRTVYVDMINGLVIESNEEVPVPADREIALAVCWWGSKVAYRRSEKSGISPGKE